MGTEQDQKLLSSLNKFTNYHVISKRFIDSLGKIIDTIEDEKTWYQLQAFEETSQPAILEHFDFEEKIVFPAIILSNRSKKTVSIIINIVKEHGMLQEKLNEVHKILSKDEFPLKQAKKVRLIFLLENVRTLLEKHTKYEDDTILAIMQDSKAVRSLMAQYLLDI